MLHRGDEGLDVRADGIGRITLKRGVQSGDALPGAVVVVAHEVDPVEVLREVSKPRAAGVVLAALAVQQLWGHLFFDLVAVHLLRAEAAVGLREKLCPGAVRFVGGDEGVDLLRRHSEFPDDDVHFPLSGTVPAQVRRHWWPINDGRRVRY